VVFYMSAAQCELIARELQQRGLPPDYPVVLVERATWPDQRVLPTTVGELAREAQAAELKSPTLLIVGEVTSLARMGLVTAERDNAGAEASGGRGC
jgi:siroheme synthase